MAGGKKKETLTPEERLQAELIPESEQPYKVPENWCWIRISDIAQILNGFAFKSQMYADSGIRIIRISNVQDGYIKDDKPVFYPLDSQDFIKSFMLRDRDLLMSLTGNVGRVAIIDNSMLPAALNQRVACIRMLNPDHNKCFLFYYFLRKEFIQDCIKNSKGSAQLNMSTEWLKGYPIPLPPLAEQQRIIDRIESLFAKLDEAKQKAQDALDSFETRKAAILHKAFTGKLTTQWRKEHGVGMETWSSCKLIDILVEKPRNGYSPKPVDYVTACKSMTLSATTTGVFKPEFFKYIDEEIPEDSHLWLTPGDILIQRANSLEKVGMSAIYTGAEHEFIYPDLMMKLTVKEPNNKHYIDYYLKTDEILNYFRSNATGTAGNMPKINQKVVSETPLILPETQEQAEIVCLLDDLLAREQQAKEAAEGVLEQIDLIKKAILARAFRGELGTNDPSEESAVELVKRVLAVEPPPKARAKAVSIPREVEEQLKSELERKIIKLYYYLDSQSLPINTLMEVSSKKFEVLESIRNLEQRGIIKKLPNGNYKLVR